MSRNKIIIIVALVVVLIIILLYVFRDNLFAATPKVNTIINSNTNTNSSVFPLKRGTIAPEVGRLQTYLHLKGGRGCNGAFLQIDNNFGPETECATKQVLGTTQVTESLFKSLGI